MVIDSAAPGQPTAIAGVSPAHLRRALASSGLWFDLGSTSVRIVSAAPALAQQLHQVYGRFPFVTAASWADRSCASRDTISGSAAPATTAFITSTLAR